MFYTSINLDKNVIYLTHLLNKLPAENKSSFIHPKELETANIFKSSYRRKEFLSSRYLFHLTTSSFNPLLRNKDRSPLFPLPWKGSISHKHDLLALAVRRDDSCHSIGIDLETTKIPNAVIKRITSEEERGLLEEKRLSASDKQRYNSLLFSCKESIYKCFSKFTKGPLTFKKIQIKDFQQSNQSWSAKIFLNEKRNKEIKGLFKFFKHQQSEYILTYTDF